ncbi:MAG TPA: SDR family oxidoreductase [Candidatus Acidoferrales bacterium]|nr:SDR family oxidoreductase [Candidatus Acidoferrales bacterium]
MFEPDLLKGRVVLITGGGTGLGRAMALRLAGLGAGVFLVGRREAPLEETAGEIRRRGASAGWASADVRDFAAVERAIECAGRELGPVDSLINNAAGNFLARTERLSPNGFAAVVGIVLQGSFHCTLALGRRWIDGGRPGRVVNILTTYASSGSPFVVPSASAKAGVLAMTRSLAVEWAHHHIRLNAIAPGPFPTEGAWSRLVPSPEIERSWLQQQPMGRFGRQEELANLAAFLLSDQAEYINGECIAIDGGLSACGAGGFSHLLQAPADFWSELERRRTRSA